jgi:hypothetical protein
MTGRCNFATGTAVVLEASTTKFKFDFGMSAFGGKSDITRCREWLVWLAPFQPLPHGEPPALSWGSFRCRGIKPKDAQCVLVALSGHAIRAR